MPCVFLFFDDAVMDELKVQEVNEVRCASAFDIRIPRVPALDGTDGDVEIGGKLADGHAGGGEKLTKGHVGHRITSSTRLLHFSQSLEAYSIAVVVVTSSPEL